jgi:hypothetical protein
VVQASVDVPTGGAENVGLLGPVWLVMRGEWNWDSCEPHDIRGPLVRSEMFTLTVKLQWVRTS